MTYHRFVIDKRARSLLLTTLVAAPLVFAVRPARAGDEAAAEALFGEAKRLAAEGKYAEACPKFAESNRLDRGAGTLIHLADCYEKNHQTASAWATFKDASNAAQALNRADWQKLATDRAAALEKKLARLTIRVQEPADKIEVTRDGSPTSSASWGTALPVDTGKHVIHASAPGRRAYDTTIEVKADGESAEVVVPKLEIGDGGGSSSGSGDGSSQRTIGFVVGGVGVVGVAVGAITGLMAIGKNNDAKTACPNEGRCASKDGVDANDSAKSLGTVSTIAFVVGGLAVATGIVLVVTAPKSTEKGAQAKALRLAPAAGPNGGGLVLGGSF